MPPWGVREKQGGEIGEVILIWQANTIRTEAQARAMRSGVGVACHLVAVRWRTIWWPCGGEQGERFHEQCDELTAVMEVMD